MTTEYLLQLVTILVAFVLGYIAKKHPKIKNQFIPIQNLLVGIIITIINWVATGDFNIGIAASGLLAGGTYDLVHNLEKFLGGE